MSTFGPDRGSSTIDACGGIESPEMAPSSRDTSSEDVGNVRAGSTGLGSGNAAVVGVWRGVAWEGVAVMCAGMTVGWLVDMGCRSGDVSVGDPVDGSMGDCRVVVSAGAAVFGAGASVEFVSNMGDDSGDAGAGNSDDSSGA
jgi:hypothetical protein